MNCESNDFIGLNVAGKGEVVECSPTQQPELFFAVLGGLGQFGIITRAAIALERAPQRVRWVRALYTEFEAFRRDQELLISGSNVAATFDYVEGFVVANSADPINGWPSVAFAAGAITQAMIPPRAGPVLYCLEVTKTYSAVDLPTLDQVPTPPPYFCFNFPFSSLLFLKPLTNFVWVDSLLCG